MYKLVRQSVYVEVRVGGYIPGRGNGVYEDPEYKSLVCQGTQIKPRGYSNRKWVREMYHIIPGSAGSSLDIYLIQCEFNEGFNGGGVGCDLILQLQYLLFIYFPPAVLRCNWYIRLC